MLQTWVNTPPQNPNHDAEVVSLCRLRCHQSSSRLSMEQLHLSSIARFRTSDDHHHRDSRYTFTKTVHGELLISPTLQSMIASGTTRKKLQASYKRSLSDLLHRSELEISHLSETPTTTLGRIQCAPASANSIQSSLYRSSHSDRHEISRDHFIDRSNCTMRSRNQDNMSRIETLPNIMRATAPPLSNATIKLANRCSRSQLPTSIANRCSRSQLPTSIASRSFLPEQKTYVLRRHHHYHGRVSRSHQQRLSSVRSSSAALHLDRLQLNARQPEAALSDQATLP